MWVRLALSAAAALLAGCAGADVSPTDASGGPTSPLGPSAQPLVTMTVRGTASSSPCDGFVSIYIGQGLTTSLPPGSVATGGGGTADIGPVYAAWTAFFDVNDVAVTVGRQLGSTQTPEADFSQRVDDGVVTFVRSEDRRLRDCILSSTRYDRALDEQDE